MSATINIGGANVPKVGANLTVLKSERASDNNSLEHPKSIVLLSSVVSITGNTFSHQFPPYSLSILRMNTKGAASIKTANAK